jgi:hypothetical protein
MLLVVPSTLFSRRHAAGSAIYLPSPPFDLLRTTLVTRLPWNFGYRCELSTRRHRNCRLSSVFLNIFCLPEGRHGGTAVSEPLFLLNCIVCVSFLICFHLAWRHSGLFGGFVWEGQELDVGRNVRMLYWSFSIIFVLSIVIVTLYKSTRCIVHQYHPVPSCLLNPIIRINRVVH